MALDSAKIRRRTDSEPTSDIGDERFAPATRFAKAVTRSHYVGRFAPSPTGPLHFGSIVAALASYVDAKAHGGTWLVRIEDVDTQRSSRTHEQTILMQLCAYGLLADEEPVRQQDRSEHYRKALSHLNSQGFTYRCRCSRSQIASAPRNADNEAIYPGTCRLLHFKDDLHQPSSIRFNTNALSGPDATVVFSDRIYGQQAQRVSSDVGDFVLQRADGDFAYQLAVVVDDATQGVTHVVRGTDLLNNTPRQIALQRALGFATPSYMHLPIATNEVGEKLSKQTRAEPIATDSTSVLAILVRAWQHLQQEAISGAHSPEAWLKQAITKWRPARINSNGAK